MGLFIRNTHRITILLVTTLSQLHSYTNATWTGAESDDLTSTPGNWLEGYVPTGIATFDSTYSSVNLFPTATVQFDIETFYFPNSASAFLFTFTGPGALNFMGSGITGTNTNVQITMTNSDSTMGTPQLLLSCLDAPSSVSLGAASISITNEAAGTLEYMTNAGQIVLANSDGYATAPVTAGDDASIIVTNNGTITSYNESAQIFLKESTFTAGDGLVLTAINSGADAIIESESDTGQMVFDAGLSTANFTAGNNAILTFTNEDSASIVSNTRSNNAGQIVFDGHRGTAAFTLGDSATLSLTNDASTISNVSTGDDLGQMVFDGNNGIASFAAGNSANLTFINKNGGSLLGLGFDTGQLELDGDGGAVSFTVGTNANITFTNESDSIIESESSGNDAGQLVVDGDYGTVSFTIGDGGSIHVTNSGSISSLSTASYTAQILFDGSEAMSPLSLTTGSGVTITATNNDGATISNSGTTSAAQMYFSSTVITGNPTLTAINLNPTIGTIQGIIFDGTSTADDTNIVLENTSLVVDIGSLFSIASLTGDSTSVVNLYNDLEIDTDSGAYTTFAGVISDSSSRDNNLYIAGSGTQALSGDNTFGGSTTVTDATLALTGSVLHNITVTGGTLSGTGQIGGDLSISSGGTVSPGISGDNSLRVGGTLVLSSGSVTDIEINPSGQNAKIVVTGAATLGGTVYVTQDAGAYRSGKQYTILTAASHTGAFEPTVTGGSGLVFSISYSTEDVYLTSQLYQIPTGGLSGPALTVANYLNHHGTSLSLAPFQGLSGGELDSALLSTSPARNAFGPYITQQTAFSLSMFMSGHIDALRSSAELPSKETAMIGLLADASDSVQSSGHTPAPKSRFSGWVSAFGEYAHQSEELKNPAFNYISEALLAGIDYRGERRNVIGGALGYAHTHFNENSCAGHGNINYYFTSIYANAFYGDFYLSPAIWGLFDQIQNRRRISFTGFSETAKANIYSWQLVPHLELGYEKLLSWGEILPFSALDWAITWQRGYSEHGASPFNATSKSHSNSMARSETGLKFCEKWSFCWGAFFLREKVSYVFQKPFGTGIVNSAFTGIPTSFTISAVNQNLNLGDVAIDFTAAIGKRNPTCVSLGYEGEFGSKYWSNQLMLTVKKDF